MDGERERGMCEAGWTLRPAQHCEVAEHHILPPTQRHTTPVPPAAISATLLPTRQSCEAARLYRGLFSVPSQPSLQGMGEWEERHYLRGV